MSGTETGYLFIWMAVICMAVSFSQPCYGPWLVLVGGGGVGVLGDSKARPSLGEGWEI